MNESLSLESYALSLAHLLRRRGEPIANVLGSLNITAEAFKQAEIHWNKQLEQSLARRQGMLAMKFAAAFAEARNQVGLLDPTDESAPARAPKPQMAPEVPSFLKAQIALSEQAYSPWAPGPPGVPAMPAAPVPPAPPAVGRVPDNLRGTALHDPGAAPSHSLPFQPGAPPPPAPPPPQDPRPVPRGPGTGTALLDSHSAASQSAMPWGSEIPSLTIEQYASLVVEITRRPPNLEHLLARYGIQSHEQHRRLESAMKAQFLGDPALRSKYDALIMRFTTMQAK